MANLSLREAVKAFDVSRPTLTKAINSGKISGVRNGKGQWEIDPSEMARVYQPRQAQIVDRDVEEEANVASRNMQIFQEVDRLRSELALTQARAEAAEKLAQERAERIEDLRRMLPPPATHTKARSWWPWRK
ncbi:MAG: hypothetical protein HWE39_03935 [Oceanospirillaceae bacterium]|uniref:hypothetical protein n=1 Tax=Roseobacteraceae TaxID=2854170 RepID=UPI00142E45CC|nr:hypothetical protein [Salipiger sp. HF18]NIY97921.1 hypothetical protein [Salipiger sp. HF18]NVK40370.1 hypothetical protein [Oceanospirillaceae bacterium]